MADTGAVTTSHLTHEPGFIRYTWNWTSSSAGGGLVELGGIRLNGRVVELVTTPGTAGTQPDDNYNVMLEDPDGFDVLQTLGTNRDELNAEDVPIVFAGTSLHPVVLGSHTLKVAAAGNANTGTITMYVARA